MNGNHLGTLALGKPRAVEHAALDLHRRRVWERVRIPTIILVLRVLVRPTAFQRGGKRSTVRTVPEAML